MMNDYYITGDQDYNESIKLLKDAIENTDAILIGAGAGLSTAAGFTYTGKRFHTYFHDFEVKYQIKDMYSGGFYPFETKEEFWAYWSRYIYVNRYTDAPKNTYNLLFELVKDKDYFVLTTNVDHCFQKAGFDKQRLFYTQGDYGLLQCSVPCHQETYDNEDIIMEMVKQQKSMKIPIELIPHCPHCGHELIPNLRSDQYFVEDHGWHQAAKRYNNFVSSHKHKKMLYFELGVGSNTPTIIKYPFWRMTLDHKEATYACISKDFAIAPANIGKRSILMSADAHQVLTDLTKGDSNESNCYL